MNGSGVQGRYRLRLYNLDRTPEMEALAVAFRTALDSHFPGDCTVEIVDVFANPERAVEDGVFVTPTLVKELPEPMARVIGDISDPDRILMLLGLVCEEAQAERDGDTR